jgi:DNA-binding SARP family transcriptional activator
VTISVLGPLEAHGTRLSPRERTALSVLALRAPEPVSPDDLADALWGDHPPETWAKQVQVCISRLRAKLPTGSVETTAHGYRLVAPGPNDLDVRAFEEGVRAARDLKAAGGADRAVTAFARALALWRGRVYEDLVDWPGAGSERARLTELREHVQEEWLECRLASGEHGSVTGEAEALVAQAPLRERRWILLALAQYRSGRQGDALATLRRARHVLATELGVDPGQELLGLEQDVLRHDPRLEPPSPAPSVSTDCPYQGLTPFDPDDHELYFGRSAEVDRCLARLRADGFLVLAGASGCGKSSLLRAGLMPALKRAGVDVRYLLPGTDPLRSLYSALAEVAPGVPLVVDQVEELFLLGHLPSTVSEFCDRIAAEAGRRPVLLAIRVDQLGELGVDAGLGELVERGLHLVRPLGEEELREVIEAPAAAAGLRIEAGLSDLLMRDASEGPSTLPLLSHTLVETWRHRDGAVLTVEGYRAAGGISGAVARTAEEVYDRLSEGERAHCRTLLLHLVELPDDGPPVCRRRARRLLRGDLDRERVLARLVEARLLTLQEDTVEVAHEALVRAWPRLRAWLDEDAEGLRMLRHIALAAEGWDALGRPLSELYRGPRLELARERAEQDPAALTPLDHEFLAASDGADRHERQGVARAAERERRTNRRLRLLLVSTASLLLVALVAGGLAVRNRNNALQQRASAQLEALVGRSLALRSTDRDTAALLAVEAYRRFPDEAAARSALLGTFTGAPGFVGYRHFADVARLDGTALPDGSSVLVVLDGQRAVTLDLETGATEDVLDALGRHGVVADATMAVDQVGQTVAVVAGGVLTVDELGAERRLVGPLEVADGASLALAPGGAVVATSDPVSGDVVVRRVSDGQEMGIVPGLGEASPDNDGAGLAFLSPRRLMVGSPGELIRIIDVPDMAVVAEIEVPALASNLHVLAADKDLVVTAGSRHVVALDPTSGRVRWQAELRTSGVEPCRHLAVSVEMGRLYCGDPFGVIEQRELDTGFPTGDLLDLQLGDVGDLAVADGGRELVAFGPAGATLSRWRLDGSGPVTTRLAEGHALMDGFDAVGERFLVARRPPGSSQWYELTDYALWHPVDDRPVVSFPGPIEGMGWIGPEALVGASFPAAEFRYYRSSSPSVVRTEPITASTENIWPSTVPGVYYTTGGGVLRTFDLTTGRPAGPGVDVGGPVTWLTTSPGGSRIAVTVADGVGGSHLRMLDATSGEVVGGPVPGVDRVAVSTEWIAGARGGSVTVYDPETLAPVHDLPGARGEVNLLQFSADGAVLMAVSNDQTVSVFDTTDWVRLGDPIPFDAPLSYPAAIHPDGESVLVTVERGVARWDLDAERLSEAACRLAGRNLTETEWAAYLKGLGPYRRTCTL